MATEPVGDMEFLWKWRKYLLLLATLVASVTYVAGLNPPGGIRSEDGGNNAPDQHRVVGVNVNPPAPAVYPFRVGDPVLVHTYSRRYRAFFYCNAAAFVASLVIIMFLLDRRISGNRLGLTVLRSAMLLDLLALMAAFAAGSCRDVVASIYVSALFALVFAYVAVHVRLESHKEPADESHLKERRKFLLLLATFATPLTYGAGLAPPGGFWSATEDHGHRAGAPLLHDGPYKIRYHAFFYANANSFVASLAIIMLLMSSTLSGRLARSYALPVCVLVELLGLMAAYAAGSCRWITTTVYIACLVGAVFLYILLQVVIAGYVSGILKCATNLSDTGWKLPSNGNSDGLREEDGVPRRRESINGQGAEKVEESRSLLLLLATLAATVTYQAGLSPPGGVWPEGHLEDHIAGNPVLQDMRPSRYKAFYHCNTAAFVASLVVIVIVQSKELSSGAVVRRAALNTVMILDLFGLMGAYVAGSCRDTATTVYVAALAVGVFVYAIAKVVAFSVQGKHSRLTRWVQSMRDDIPELLQLASDESPRQRAQGAAQVPAAAVGQVPDDDESPRQRQGGEEPEQHQGAAQVDGEPGSEDEKKRNLERKRKFLLQLAILAATVTYQTGLNPPGGFWTESDDGDKSVTAGDPVLLDHYGARYQVFFYCNATGFMASVAVILLLVNQTLSKQGIRSHALHVCILVGLLGLMGAYAAGSCRKLRTSIYVFALVAAVVAFLLLQILLYVFADRDHWLEQLPWLPPRAKALFKPLWTGPAGCGGKDDKSKEDKLESERYLKRKYLMVLGILAASVTYQAGLAPPGGTWGDDDTASSSSPSPTVVAGNPILLGFNTARYQAFFYCNATSFVASIVVIMLLLQRTLRPHGAPLWAMQTAVVLDLLGLLGAYAAGSCRDWETSAYVIALVAAVVLFIALHVLLSFDAVFHRAKKLLPNKCLGVDDHQVSRNGSMASA